jgi:dTMP kinase
VTGHFIVLEGLDGSGITTQGRLLRDWLGDERDIPAIHTQEPSEGPVGSLIRQALRHRVNCDPATLALLFAADRLDHLTSDIQPRLDAGYVVVCDRYYLSSLAYQTSEIQDTDWLVSINSRARQPDLTLFFDVPVETCLARIARARHETQRFERAETLARVRSNFLRFIEELRERGERIDVVDGSRPIDDVRADVRSRVDAFLNATRT